jgi:hypothetical protein
MTEVPAAPESMVHDEGRILGSAATQHVSRILQGTLQDTGVAAYLVTTAFLDTAEARDHMQRLVESWLAGREGVILICNRSNGQFGISASPQLWRRHAADEISQLLSETGHAMSLAGASREKSIQESVVVLDDGIRRLIKGHAGKTEKLIGAERRLGLMLAAALALVVLVAWLVSIARRRNRAAMGGPFWFPDARVNPRLGGQSGAALGEASERRSI